MVDLAHLHPTLDHPASTNLDGKRACAVFVGLMSTASQRETNVLASGRPFLGLVLLTVNRWFPPDVN
jgi:hypothetical protein